MLLTLVLANRYDVRPNSAYRRAYDDLVRVLLIPRQQIAEILRPALCILLRVSGVYAQLARGAGHELHQPGRALRGNCPGIAAALAAGDCPEEIGVDVPRLPSLLEIRGVSAQGRR